MKKNVGFILKFQNFEPVGVLGLQFSEKHNSEANKYWRAANAKQGFHFSIIFKNNRYLATAAAVADPQKIWRPANAELLY